MIKYGNSLNAEGKNKDNLMHILKDLMLFSRSSQIRKNNATEVQEHKRNEIAREILININCLRRCTKHQNSAIFAFYVTETKQDKKDTITNNKTIA